MKQFDRVMIDADVCLNLVKYEKKNALRCVIENIAQEIDVHEYLLENELLSSACACEIQQLIVKGRIKVLSPLNDLNEFEKQNYIGIC